jgi:hypothetical protein
MFRMKKEFIIIIGSMICLTSCQDESKIDEIEIRLSQLESTVSNFDRIVQEQDSIKREKEAELKQFEDLIVKAFHKEFGSLEFRLTDYIGESNINHDMDKTLIDKSFVSRGRFLYSSMFDYDVYEWELTSKGRNGLYKKEEDWNKNISDYEERWFFIYGKSKFNGVTKVEYINSKQTKVTYETVRLSITDLAAKDWYIGEINEHELEFKKASSNWIISESEPFSSYWVR